MDIRDKFKIKIYQSDGQQYEDLFTQVMSRAQPGFSPVKAHGNIGDRGNDGWVEHLGTYYQCYAPKELFENTVAAQNKVKADFKKLKDYWSSIAPIKVFYFVVNDKYQGVSPHISKTLSELRVENGLEVAAVFSTLNLENAFFSLPYEVICSILGLSPQQADPLVEDKNRVRKFLDTFAWIFSELSELGREAGYFFPSRVFHFINQYNFDSWDFDQNLSNNATISSHQNNIKNQLIQMNNQIIGGGYYNDIGLSFKFQPPYNLEGRDELIEQRKNSMGSYIQEMLNSYWQIRDYGK